MGNQNMCLQRREGGRKGWRRECAALKENSHPFHQRASRWLSPACASREELIEAIRDASSNYPILEAAINA